MNEGILTTDRTDRVARLLQGSAYIVKTAIEKHITSDEREVAAVALLFSGGNDSTTMADIFRPMATHAVMCNTGIGIEQTRQFVRDTCAMWELPLIEHSPPADDTYEQQIIKRGFPGPTQHPYIYWRLKGRQIRLALKELNPDPRKYRVAFIGGRRRAESTRRKNIPASRREGSAVYIDPLIHWTTLDMNTYRLMHPNLPHNEVTDLLHKSGECLCGCFGTAEELNEIRVWYPEVAAEIRRLEKVAASAGQKQCTWGWGKSKNGCQNGCNI